MDQQQTSATAASVDEETTVQYLTFLLGEEVYAMDISAVREIIQYAALTPVPLMPAYVRGVINLRGAVVPVIDLKARFGWARSIVGKKTCIVIFDASQQGERMELGLMVDAVSEVVDLVQSQIDEAPPFGSAIRRDYMRGVGKIKGRFVAIIDPDRALNVEDMAQVEA